MNESLRKTLLMFSIPTIVALGSALVVVWPGARESLQAKFFPPKSEVLATAEGDALNDGGHYKLIKIRKGDGLYVDVVRMIDGEPKDTLDRILLPDSQDGLFNYESHVTRLALIDIDEDGTLEVVAPTFDKQLVPHLNVYRYDPAMKHFSPVIPKK